MEDRKFNELSDDVLDKIIGGNGACYRMNKQTGQYDVIDRSTGNTLCSFSSRSEAEEKVSELSGGGFARVEH